MDELEGPTLLLLDNGRDCSVGWELSFARRVLTLHGSLLARGVHPLQCWAEISQLVSVQQRELDEDVGELY